ncbi:MAG TPA: DUF167 domain-containing protein [Ktedonobacterales bacterium]|nr:DUF167 domain-containing protein [Ktedonobacterales bacterium]
MVAQPPHEPHPAGAASASPAAPLTIGAARGALTITVRVIPRASRDTLTIEDRQLRVRLRAAPVDGAANAALIALLAERLGLPRRSLAITQGQTARVKRLSITGLTEEELRQRIASALS